MMYHVYVKEDSAFDAERLVGEYSDVEEAFAKVEEIVEKDASIKYVIKETDGHVDNYGELITSIVDEN